MGYFDKPDSFRRGKDEHGRDMNLKEWRQKTHDLSLREAKERREREASYYKQEDSPQRKTSSRGQSSLRNASGKASNVVKALFPVLKAPTVRNSFKTLRNVTIGHVAYACSTGNVVDLIIDPALHVIIYVAGGVSNTVEFIENLTGDKEVQENKQKNSNDNPTSMVELQDNKTLVLFPDHALDAEKVMNPQWRLQLG